MGGKSSKYVKKYEYHAHLHQIQQLLEELQQQQSSFSTESRMNTEKFEEYIGEMKERQDKQENLMHITEQQLHSLKEKLCKLNELDSMKQNLHKVTLEHNEDRVKMSSNLKEAIGKEKNKWQNDVMELKERLEGIKQYSMELVTMDLQHEREIKDLQKRIYNLETKMRHASNNNNNQIKNKNVVESASDYQNGNVLKSSKLSTTSTPLKTTSFASPVKPKRTYIPQPVPSEIKRADSCNVCNAVDSTAFIKDINMPSSSSSYHLKFSKINMAMQKLKDDIKFAELKKNTAA